MTRRCAAFLRLPDRALTAATLTASALLALVSPAAAQTTETPSLTDLIQRPAQPGEQMLVEADRVVYDIDDGTIVASGSVVIYYADHVLVADEVGVDRRNARVTARGGVELTDPSGAVVRAASLELDDDLATGVIEALELVTEERVALRATRAVRTGGDVTTLENGEYLPCVDCDGVPGREPTWRIRAREVVHRQGERTITYRDATFEFLGVPVAYVPYFSNPDPTVRRRTGFLAPRPVFDEELGFGGEVPYFWALTPQADITFRPGFYSRQGVLLDAEFRHRIEAGQYSVRAAGIYQFDPDAFEGTSGDREWRGALFSEGDFAINERWRWGWTITAPSDRAFLRDYDRGDDDDGVVVSDVFLEGVDDRNRLEAHLYGFAVTQEDQPGLTSLQAEQPFVHPVVDHSVNLEDIFGGELRIDNNLTSLSRNGSDLSVTDGETVYRGLAGFHNRLSTNIEWQRRFIDPIGQVFEPFAYVRADAFLSNPKGGETPGYEGETAALRGMAGIGLEYSFPILAASSFGNQVFEPVAQLILRPDETYAGELPNEDAQSLVFDDSSLFEFDKFSGFDRLEGGSRANLGLQYTAQLNGGASINALVGQSYRLFGDNPFAADTPYGTGEGSGLDSDVSDVVARLGFNTGEGLQVATRARFDDDDLSLERLEGQAIGISGPLSASLTYAFFSAPFGIENGDYSEITTAANLRLTDHTRAFGNTRFDVENEELVRYGFGVAYDDESLTLALSYEEDRTQNTTDDIDRTVFLRLGLRTLGDTEAGIDFD